jgi:hypothetical protein
MVPVPWRATGRGAKHGEASDTAVIKVDRVFGVPLKDETQGEFDNGLKYHVKS